jgi:cellobiose-specific phosphotransferase system component IIB
MSTAMLWQCPVSYAKHKRDNSDLERLEEKASEKNYSVDIDFLEPKVECKYKKKEKNSKINLMHDHGNSD